MKYPKSVATIAAALFIEASAPGLTAQRQGQYEQSQRYQNITSGWEVSQTYQPPDDIEAPPKGPGTGSRGGPCIASSAKGLTVLIPKIPKSNELGGLTVSEYPTFFGYIPKTSAKTGEFMLQEQNGRIVYRKSFAIPSKPGIVSISLPTTGLPPLQVGNWYKWSLVIVCNPSDPNDNAIASGWISRIEPSETLVDGLKNATPQNIPFVYANAGIWQEALASIVEQRRSRPNDETVAGNWEEMLKSVGREAFILEPLVDCCKMEN